MTSFEHLATKRSFVITLGMLIGAAAVTIDISLPAIPAMSAAFGIDVARGQWIIGLFMAGMATGQIPSGLLSDRYGRLPVLYGGIGLFLVASVVATISTDITVMLISRYLQGVGASSAIVLSRAIVRDVASGKDAARLMSLVAMIFAAAPVLAPSLGAALIGVGGWRATFAAVVVFAITALMAIRINVPETHTPSPPEHAWQQLKRSFGEFFSHRQSVFGLMLIILPPIGFMSVITTSSALVVETYGLSLRTFGFMFAAFGIAILLGSGTSRALVDRLSVLRLLQLAVGAMAVAAVQLAIMVYLNEAPIIWLWSCASLFMFSVGILAPNATVLALDPLPNVAGVASSILGTLQNVTSMIGALGAAWLYTGSVRNSMLLMTAAGLATTLVWLARPLICPTTTVPSAPTA